MALCPFVKNKALWYSHFNSPNTMVYNEPLIVNWFPDVHAFFRTGLPKIKLFCAQTSNELFGHHHFPNGP